MPKNRCRLVGPARIALLLTSIVVLFATLATSSFAASRAPKHRNVAHSSRRTVARKKMPTVGALPAEGIFGGCSLSASVPTCEQNLLQIHQAGMQVDVVGLTGASLDEISTFASYAQSIGMTIMWEINDPGYWGGAWIGSSAAGDWPSFSTACGCTDTSQVLISMIQFLASLPATYGYYAADDWTLTPSDRGGLKQYVDEIKAVDPNHMVMVGSAQGDGTTYYSSGATMGNEIYPETTQSLMPYNRNVGMWQSIQDSIGQDQRAASNDGTSSAFILQAFTFGDNIWDGQAVGVCTAAMSQAQCAGLLQYPSAGVQLELRNMVLQHSQAKLILWYTFDEASEGSRWADLSSVISAPLPASASTARAKHGRRTARTHGARRRSVGHTHAR